MMSGEDHTKAVPKKPIYPNATPLSDQEVSKFWGRVDRAGPDDCWIWKGSRGAKGYGRMKTLDGKSIAAHRVAILTVLDEIPEDKVVDHICRNRGCCNPNHLRILTSKENILCGVGPTAENARKDFCHDGHPFDDENTIHMPSGRRSCRACQRAHERRYRKRVSARVAFTRDLREHHDA